MDESKQEPERELKRIYRRWTGGSRIDVLSNFIRQNPDMLVDGAAVAAEETVGSLETKFSIGAIDGWSSLKSDVTFEIAKSNIEEHIAMINAFSLVFWHSLLDAIALDLCALVAEYFPERWQADLDSCGVKVEEVRTSSYEQIRHRLLRKRIDKLERESLEEKLETVYKLCTASFSWSHGSWYEFDWDVLRRLDRFRHELVHGNALATSHRHLDRLDLHYLRVTAGNLIYLVADSFDLHVPELPVHLYLPKEVDNDRTND